MRRPAQPLIVLLLCISTALTGCHPQQPFYFHEDGDLSHYVDVATDLEYPDTQTCTLDDVTNAAPPLSLDNPTPREIWELKLEEAVKYTLANSKVMRSLSGRFVSQASLRAQTGDAPDALITRPEAVPTVYDPAIVESSPFGGAGQLGVQGVEAALSAFDAQFTSNLFWEHNNRPQNVRRTNEIEQFFVPTFEQQTSTFNAQISKVTATGGQFVVRNNTLYDANNNPTRQVYSDWNVNFETSFSQPLLRGSGAQYNRIAGPDSPFTGIGTPQFDGVMLARINTDISLADFEGGVRNLVSDTENSYWELYFAYRNLEATKAGRASALQTWEKVHELYVQGSKGGELDKEAQAREQYFFFRSQVQQALNDLYRAENRLRYMMGLSVSDGRLIRPADEPTTARVVFDWYEVHAEGLSRSVELRRQRWRIKERELELIAARNLLQPRLDAVGRYRWLGLGDDLLDTTRQPSTGTLEGTNAFQELTSGKFQEWQLGLQGQIPIGFRRELSAVRNFELQLARERARMQDQELEVSHQMGDAVRNLEGNYDLAQTNFNRRVAAENQVEAVRAAFEADTVTLDLLLDAQRRRADAEIAYYRSLVDYVRGILLVHYRKGSLLEYNGVYLAEGPWPQKAYFDAERMAQQRDASYYLDYGYTRPRVISQGPYLQHAQDGGSPTESMLDMHEGMPHEAMQGQPFEEIQSPAPAEMSEPLPEPTSQPNLNSGARSAAPRKMNQQRSPIRNARPIKPSGERQISSMPRQQSNHSMASRDGGDFEWGRTAAEQPKAQSRIVPKQAEPKAAVEPTQASAKKPATIKRAVAEEAAASPSKAVEKPEAKTDADVHPASHQEWQSKSDAAARSASATGAAGGSTSGWKAAKR